VRGTVTLLFLLGAAVTGFGVGLPVVAIAAEYEVWVIDQSDTTPDGGVPPRLQALAGGWRQPPQRRPPRPASEILVAMVRS
jgi:hypothetical protein